jgi:hypothetical protein
MSKFLLTAALSFIPVTFAALAQHPTEDVEQTIKTMERAALDRSDQGDVRGFLEITDPNVVYVDPYQDKPLYGRDALAQYYAKAYEGYKPVRGEMLNSKVQVLGDSAVLTFNYVGAAKPTNGWICTEVYHRTQAGWRIVLTNWAFVKPQMP